MTVTSAARGQKWPLASLCGAAGQVADCLAKVARQASAAAADAAKRQELLAAVAELDGARAEAAWLAAYEQDEDRYKVSPLLGAGYVIG